MEIKVDKQKAQPPQELERAIQAMREYCLSTHEGWPIAKRYDEAALTRQSQPQELVATLKAILREESHNETCSSLFGGTQPLCDCWKSKI